MQKEKQGQERRIHRARALKCLLRRIIEEQREQRESVNTFEPRKSGSQAFTALQQSTHTHTHRLARGVKRLNPSRAEPKVARRHARTRNKGNSGLIIYSVHAHTGTRRRALSALSSLSLQSERGEYVRCGAAQSRQSGIARRAGHARGATA